MFSQAKLGFISLLLFSFVVSASFPNSNHYLSKDENIIPLKQAQEGYIQQDARITTDIALSHFISNIKKTFIHSDVDEKETIKLLKASYPQIKSITKIKQNKLTLSEIFQVNIDKSAKSAKYFYNINEQYYVTIPIIRENERLQYHIVLTTDIFSDIVKKQQSRMFTVTHLQNNRWKTNPTKYTPKKKLGMSIDERLPNLKPDENDTGISHYIQQELVIKFKNHVIEKEIQSLVKTYNLTIKKRRDHTIIVKCVKHSTKDLLSLIEKEKNDLIEYIEPHFIYLTNEEDIVKKSLFIPNDSLYLDYQWNLPLIFTEEGWQLTKGKENVIIAIIDTGVDLNHPEFVGKLVKGMNMVEPSSPPMDDDGHGTHVAGIIAANTNNREGIAGITWYNKIMPIKVLDQSGAGTLFDVAEGIFWAVEHGAKVINLSLGNYAESNYLHDAIKYAYDQDVVIISAAGNDNIGELGYPASYPEVIGVAAIDPLQRKAEFSNYGTYVDVTAPGVNIASTYPDNEYASLSGTSMASPHVAALAGLIRSMNPALTNKEVMQIIKETATDLGEPGKDPYYGYGEINIAKAVEQSIKQHRVKSILLFWLKFI